MANMTLPLLCQSLSESPLILSVPHSGRLIPKGLVSRMRHLDVYQEIEDPMVEALLPDELRCSKVVLEAARLVCDVNRHPWEWDGQLFFDKVPPEALSQSAKVRSGLGFIPRLGNEGRPLWKQGFSVAEGREHLSAYHVPYHRALMQMIDGQSQLGISRVLVLDCHSMPKIAGFNKGHRRIDICLGNDHTSTSHDETINTLAEALRGQGFRISLNDPFAGGYIIRHHARIIDGVEAIQMEINRALYWDENYHCPSPDFDKTKARLKAGLMEFCTNQFPDFYA
jgi:N-formylglutamate amidohydrolase